MKVHENVRLLAATAAALLLAVSLAQAKDAVPNLGGGLEDLVTGGNKSLRRAAVPELSVTHPIRLDDAGRALVRISLNGKVQAAKCLAEPAYHTGRGSRGLRPELSRRRHRGVCADRRTW